MNRLTQYLLRQCLSLTLMVTLVLTAASWLVQSLKLIEYVVDRGVGLFLFIELMVLSLPQLMELVVPIGCFIGVLFTYNKLIADSELVVMRACGSSQWDLARPAVLLAAAGTAVMFSLSLYFLPASKNTFKDLQFQIRNQFNSGLLQEGTFNTLGEHLVVYVRERSASGTLQGLLIQDTRDPTKSATFTAATGLITQVDGRPNVLMINGTKQVWDAKKKELLDPVTFSRYTLDLEQFKDTVATRVLQPDERYLPDLFNPKDVEGDPRVSRPADCRRPLPAGRAALLHGLRGDRAGCAPHRRAQSAWPDEAAPERARPHGRAADGRSRRAQPDRPQSLGGAADVFDRDPAVARRVGAGAARPRSSRSLPQLLS